MTLCFAPHDSYFPRKIFDGIWKKNGQKGGRKGRKIESEDEGDAGGVMEIRGKNTMNTQGETNPRNQTFHKISTCSFRLQLPIL